ncbi:hypothetical protein N783_11820 [Pontibacillus marinus BH030004 = DSM 16465]|uniref:Ankyrin n=1 Tax=Pontibacillus marinus BH030004 = DSM 16465 TaxID=1385511 RepID=A0A0A5G0N9_9BACI|nr:hypothetical protein N783_11820 [Pontibacillus marinus BH030004 = DSM 16465]
MTPYREKMEEAKTIIENNNKQMAKKLLNKPFRFFHPNSTYLTLACKNGNTGDIRYLLENGADPNKEGIGKRTPLNMVCGDVELLEATELLVEYGADVNEVGSGGSPLGRALRSSYQICEKLLELGATPNASLMNVVGREYSVEYLKLFLSNGAELPPTILKEALRGKNYLTLRYLISNGFHKTVENTEYQEWYIRPYNEEDKGLLELILANIHGINLEKLMMLALDEETVKILIKAGADINSRDTEGNTKLYKEMEKIPSKTKFSFIVFLIKQGADPNLKNHDNKCPIDLMFSKIQPWRPLLKNEKWCFRLLYETTDYENIKRKITRYLKKVTAPSDIEFFIEEINADPNIFMNPLLKSNDHDLLGKALKTNKVRIESEYVSAALENENLHMVNHFMNYGYKLSDNEIKRALQIALEKKLYEYLKIFLEALNDDERLYSCVVYCYQQALKLDDYQAIRHMIGIGYSLPSDFDLALEIFEKALYQNDDRGINHVLDCYGKDVLNVDIDNDTVLTFLYKNGNYKMMEKFLVRGADPNQLNSLQETPIHLCVMDNNSRIFQSLVSFGADLRKLYKKKESPIGLALQHSHYEMFRLLLENGISLNSKVLSTRHRDSLLAKSILEGKKSFAQYLLQEGADVNQKNDFNETPLHTAYKVSNKPMIELLINMGANQDIRNDYGQLPKYVNRIYR